MAYARVSLNLFFTRPTMNDFINSSPPLKIYEDFFIFLEQIPRDGKIKKGTDQDGNQFFSSSISKSSKDRKSRKNDFEKRAPLLEKEENVPVWFCSARNATRTLTSL